MRKKFGSLVVLFFVLALARKLMLWFPEPFFSDRFQYGEYTIYSHDAVDTCAPKILAGVREKIRRCVHYDPARRHRIFICPPWTFYNVFMFPENRNYAFNSGFRHNILIFQAGDFMHNTLTDPSTGRYYTFDHVIAHEITHTFVQEKLPFWKKEGYAEYIAHYQEDYVASADFRRNALALLKADGEWIADDRGETERVRYFRARILVEYLFLVKGLSFEEFRSEETGEQRVFDEVREWVEG